MLHHSEWDGDTTPETGGLTPYNLGLHDVSYEGPAADMTKTAIEEDMHASIYFVDGIFTMLFFPLRLPKLLGADARKSKSFFFPLGNKLTCIPIMASLMWLCAIGIGAQLYNAVNPRDLRTLDNVATSVSIGDPIVAITLFGGIATVVAAAVSHHPRFVRWDQEVTHIMESVPFVQSYNPFLHLAAAGAGAHGTLDLTPLHIITPQDPGTGTGTTRTTGSVISPSSRVGGAHPTQSHVHHQLINDAVGSDDRGLGHMPSSAGFSPPPAPLGATMEMRESTANVTAALPGQQRVAEFQTMDDPIPRRYIPFSHILMDEVPPLRDGTIHFVYDAAEWFEPQRQNRQQLDRSLALFRDVWTEQQKQELDAQLERRRQRESAGQNVSARNALVDNQEEMQEAAQFAVINADSAEWKPSDLFKFVIGDHIQRNAELPHLDVSFDGEHSVQQGDVFVVSNRMWHEDCALYCVENAMDSHQWQAIEALFDVVEEHGLNGTRVPVRKMDKGITVENLLLAMSGRDLLRRFDIYGNGNVASSESAMKLQAWVVALYVLLSIVLGLVPIVIRALQGGGLYASGTLGNLICTFGSLVLFVFSASSLLTFLSTTRRSLANYADTMDSFTEVTLGAASNKWYPVMNWFETTNMRSWYHLRQHIQSSYYVHYNSRLVASFTVLLLTSSWSYFVLAYCLTYPNRSRPTADGWIFQVSLVCVPLLIELYRIFDDAATVNALFLSHRAALAQIQVALDEELMLVGARTVNKNPMLQAALLATISNNSSSQTQSSSNTSNVRGVQGLSNMTIANRSNEFQFLLDAKVLLDDLRFALEFNQAPLQPFGLAVNRHLVQFLSITLVVNIVGLAIVVAGFVLNSNRWKSA